MWLFSSPFKLIIETAIFTWKIILKIDRAFKNGKYCCHIVLFLAKWVRDFVSRFSCDTLQDTENVLDLFKSCNRVIWKSLLKLEVCFFFKKKRNPILQVAFIVCSWAPFLALCCQCVWFAICMWCYVPYCHNLGRSSKLKSSPHWNETPILRRNSDLFSLTLDLELNL